MLAGHIDEIGLMVVHIDDDGFLTFDTIGGWDHQVFVGQRVVLLGREDTVHGVIGKKAIHLMEEEDRTKASKAADLWIDIGAATKAEAEARIRVGDPGVLASQVQEFPNGRLVSRSIDDRIGAFVVLEALRLLAQDQAPGLTEQGQEVPVAETPKRMGGFQPAFSSADQSARSITQTSLPSLVRRSSVTGGRSTRE